MTTFDPFVTGSEMGVPQVTRHTGPRRSLTSRLLIIVLLVVMAIVILMPLFWLVTSSLKTETQIFAYPPEWIPNPVRWENYPEALTLQPFGSYLKNTLIIVTFNVIAVVLSSSLCAYGFARLRFWGRDFWFGVVMATLFLPYAITIVPSFIIFSKLPVPQIDFPLLGITSQSRNWVNTFLPLVIPPFFGGGAFNIFLLRQFFRTIPEELADAARIDGASEFGIYWRIMLPLSKPALITVALFTFLGAWNDLLGPLIYLRKPELFTVAVGLSSYRGILDVSWHYQLAASTAMIVPVVILFFFAQRYFIGGVVLSGLRG
jgi:multiple sugar transport system permease protein